jgi:hypothetical protein
MKIAVLGGYNAALYATAVAQEVVAKGTITMWSKVGIFLKTAILPMLKALFLGIVKAGVAVAAFLFTNPIG